MWVLPEGSFAGGVWEEVGEGRLWGAVAQALGCACPSERSMRNAQIETRNPKPETLDQKPHTSKPNPRTQNPTPPTPTANAEPPTPNPKA